jgi:hypothetical protein
MILIEGGPAAARRSGRPLAAAERRVLRSIDSPLNDTGPAKRAITLRDLLTFRLDLGRSWSSRNGC